MNLDIFSKRLRALRLTQKNTLQNVGDAVGCNRQAIENLENACKSPSLDLLITLARYFGVSIDYLVGESDDPARREVCYNSTKEVTNMATATIEREEIVRRVWSLPDEKLSAVLLFIEDLEGHEPNEETVAALREADHFSRDPAAKRYTNVKEMFAELRAECIQ